VKAATPEEKRDAIDSFADYLEPTLEVVGRSELERWAECPMQASLIESGKEGPLPGFVDAGELCHQALGTAIQTWIDFNASIGPQGIREALEQSLRGTRPDLQPQVIAAARASIWNFSHFLAGINPVNILKFDGGHERQSGQLAMDIPTAGVRYAGEVDFLWSGPVRGVLQLEDWKSGWRFFRGYDVYQSFQFQSYACLILDNYEKIDAVEVRVWNTRHGTKTYPVLFERRHLDQYMSRIYSALQVRYENRENPKPTPTEEKCSRCRVALHCPASGEIGDAMKDPKAHLRRLIVLQAAIKQELKLLKAVEKQSGPIELETGERFASEHKSKPKAQLIVPKGGKKVEEENDDDSDEGSEG